MDVLCGRRVNALCGLGVAVHAAVGVVLVVFLFLLGGDGDDQLYEEDEDHRDRPLIVEVHRHGHVFGQEEQDDRCCGWDDAKQTQYRCCSCSDNTSSV